MQVLLLQHQGMVTSTDSSLKQPMLSKLCVLNAQSVCNKINLLTDYFIEHDLDLIALTKFGYQLLINMIK